MTKSIKTEDSNKVSTNPILSIDKNSEKFVHDFLSNRIKNALTLKKNNLDRYTGIPPYGYDYVNDKLVENSREKQLLKSVIYWKQEQGRTFRHIVEALNFNGYLTKKGKKWTIRTLSHIYYKAISNRLPL